MKYKAVIFDLFGTLVDIAPVQEKEEVLRQMASILAAPPDEFIKQWTTTFAMRVKGEFPDYQANIRYMCQQLGVPFEDNQLECAAELRINLDKNELRPRKGAIKVLSYLKSHGYKTGLISDCSVLVPAVWEDTSFGKLIDVTVFSCSIKVQKPHPSLYRLAVEQLALLPQDCIYIADGMSGELKGALEAGMQAVRIQTRHDDLTNPYREEWDVPVISSLTEILTLLE